MDPVPRTTVLFSAHWYLNSTENLGLLLDQVPPTNWPSLAIAASRSGEAAGFLSPAGVADSVRMTTAIASKPVSVRMRISTRGKGRVSALAPESEQRAHEQEVDQVAGDIDQVNAVRPIRCDLAGHGDGRGADPEYQAQGQAGQHVRVRKA